MGDDMREMSYDELKASYADACATRDAYIASHARQNLRLVEQAIMLTDATQKLNGATAAFDRRNARIKQLELRCGELQINLLRCYSICLGIAVVTGFTRGVISGFLS